MTEVGWDKHLFLFIFGLFVNLSSAIPVLPSHVSHPPAAVQGSPLR